MTSSFTFFILIFVSFTYSWFKNFYLLTNFMLNFISAFLASI